MCADINRRKIIMGRTIWIPKKLEFSVAPGVSLRIGPSSVVVRFRYTKDAFADYIAANAKDMNLDLNYDVVNVTGSGIAMPEGLLSEIIDLLRKSADNSKVNAPKVPAK